MNLDGIPIFETQDADFAAFLLMEDIKLLGLRRSEENPNIVVLLFHDEKQNCLDLERVWLNSEHKKYRDWNKWVLAKIHKTLREQR